MVRVDWRVATVLFLIRLSRISFHVSSSVVCSEMRVEMNKKKIEEKKENKRGREREWGKKQLTSWKKKTQRTPTLFNQLT